MHWMVLHDIMQMYHFGIVRWTLYYIEVVLIKLQRRSTNQTI